ncbi:hypothetical protein [Mesorhizobium sp. ORM16]|uniref:hypothetical protein n=1 Tax=Mesorhizobium sp. ORM16 TaxID=3376989 RepID=UPI003857315D
MSAPADEVARPTPAMTRVGSPKLMGLGWSNPVHCKSLAAQEVLTVRKLIQLRIPTKPATDSDLKPASHSDFIPATILI